MCVGKVGDEAGRDGDKTTRGQNCMRNCLRAKKHLLRERKKVLLSLILVLWPFTCKNIEPWNTLVQCWHKALVVSFLPTTFRVWSVVQTQSKESFLLEVVVRLWYNTYDIAPGANRKVETKGKAQSEGGSGPRLHTETSCPDDAAGLGE